MRCGHVGVSDWDAIREGARLGPGIIAQSRCHETVGFQTPSGDLVKYNS